MIKSFPPIADQHSGILILGTMPGEMSLKRQEYYGHAQNSFWKIMFELYGNSPFTADYTARTDLLLKNKIALWDVLKSCTRTGSLDSAIKQEVPNNFQDFFARHDTIKKIYFNGKKAKAFYDTHVGNDFGRELIQLPSTSPANATINYAGKLSLWKAALRA